MLIGFLAAVTLPNAWAPNRMQIIHRTSQASCCDHKSAGETVAEVSLYQVQQQVSMVTKLRSVIACITVLAACLTVITVCNCGSSRSATQQPPIIRRVVWSRPASPAAGQQHPAPLPDLLKSQSHESYTSQPSSFLSSPRYQAICKAPSPGGNRVQPRTLRRQSTLGRTADVHVCG